MNKSEDAKLFQLKVNFVGRLLEDKDTQPVLKEIVGEWLQDRAKEILPNKN